MKFEVKYEKAFRKELDNESVYNNEFIKLK